MAKHSARENMNGPNNKHPQEKTQRINLINLTCDESCIAPQQQGSASAISTAISVSALTDSFKRGPFHCDCCMSALLVTQRDRIDNTHECIKKSNGCSKKEDGRIGFYIVIMSKT